MTVVNRCTISFILSELKESQEQLVWYKRRYDAGIWNRPSIISEIEYDIEHYSMFIDLWMQHPEASTITVNSKKDIRVNI